MMKETMTPGPAISLATKPETTYIPVPTQLPTPSETRSKVVSTWASLVPWDVVTPVPSSMDSTGLVRRILECMAYQVVPHWIRRGSRYERKPLIVMSRWDKKRSLGKTREFSESQQWSLTAWTSKKVHRNSKPHLSEHEMTLLSPFQEFRFLLPCEREEKMTPEWTLTSEREKCTLGLIFQAKWPYNIFYLLRTCVFLEKGLFHICPL